ncbi:transcriptional regulator [Burkholderia cepacia]
MASSVDGEIGTDSHDRRREPALPVQVTVHLRQMLTVVRNRQWRWHV